MANLQSAGLLFLSGRSSIDKRWGDHAPQLIIQPGQRCPCCCVSSKQSISIVSNFESSWILTCLALPCLACYMLTITCFPCDCIRDSTALWVLTAIIWRQYQLHGMCDECAKGLLQVVILTSVFKYMSCKASVHAASMPPDESHRYNQDIMCNIQAAPEHFRAAPDAVTWLDGRACCQGAILSWLVVLQFLLQLSQLCLRLRVLHFGPWYTSPF